MRLKYKSRQRPILLAAVEGAGRSMICEMLLDTGADHTVFPAEFASFLGLDNLAAVTESSESTGIGGKCRCYMHPVKFSLLDPERSASQTPFAKVWESKVDRFGFIADFNEGFGLLGRDVMSEWRSVLLLPNKAEWIVDIEMR